MLEVGNRFHISSFFVVLSVCLSDVLDASMRAYCTMLQFVVSFCRLRNDRIMNGILHMPGSLVVALVDWLMQQLNLLVQSRALKGGRQLSYVSASRT